jgi:hypothetical protein
LINLQGATVEKNVENGKNKNTGFDILFRMQDEKNGYRFTYNSKINVFRFWKQVNGNWIRVASTAEIIVFDTDITGQADEKGFFEIRNVPAGEQSVIIGYNQRGVELIAYINPGKRTHLGTIVVPAEMEIE